MTRRRSTAATATMIGTAPALAAVTAAVSLATGPTRAYAQIFPPRWLTFIAVALLLAALAAARTTGSTRGTRAAGALGWAAAVFFFGASGGVILDGFRAFFWATGIPAGDFATVDWAGALARATSLLAALLTVVWAWRLRGRRERTPDGADAATSTRTRTALAWCAVAFAVPYPLGPRANAAIAPSARRSPRSRNAPESPETCTTCLLTPCR